VTLHALKHDVFDDKYFIIFVRSREPIPPGQDGQIMKMTTPTSGAEVRNEWICTSTPLYAFMTCTGKTWPLLFMYFIFIVLLCVLYYVEFIFSYLNAFIKIYLAWEYRRYIQIVSVKSVTTLWAICAWISIRKPTDPAWLLKLLMLKHSRQKSKFRRPRLHVTESEQEKDLLNRAREKMNYIYSFTQYSVWRQVQSLLQNGASI